MLEKGNFGGNKLTVNDIGKATAVVVSVKDARAVDVTDPERAEGVRPSVVIDLGGAFRGRTYWPNNTGVRILIDQLGADEEKWAGKKIPLVRQTTTNLDTGKKMQVLWVALPDQWPTILRESEVRRGGKKTAAKRAKKTARK